MRPCSTWGRWADSLAGVLAGGFLLGPGGTAFAVGVPFVNAWYPPERRGLAAPAGGLGGFLPPLVMGLVESATGDYSRGFVLLAATAAGAGLLAVALLRRGDHTAAQDRP
ncbi:hypothetical protein ACGFZK_10580 [Streptomyces sp. NPDC048257]|uniref:hypothetical protein n=1 Tax=Streptomyces sp. NPDC048257 TaxID=3365526 RepID=UPI0037216EEA